MSHPDRTRTARRSRGALAEMARLLPYARPHGSLFALTLVASLVVAVIDIPIPYFLMKLIDTALAHPGPTHLLGLELAPRRFLLAVFVCLAALAGGKGALLYLQRTASESMAQQVIYDLRMSLYRHLQSLSLPFFRGASTGKIMLRFMGDINAVLDLLKDGILRTLMDGITILAVTCVILALNWKLALAVLSIVPFYVAAFLRLSPVLRRAGRKARRERSALSGELQERVAGAAIVKAFHQEAAEQERMGRRTRRLRDWLLGKARAGGRLIAISNTAVALGGGIVLWAGGNAVLDGTMTKGALMAFYTLSAMLFPPLRRLARTNETYQAARVSLDRILAFLDTTEPLREREGAVDLRVSQGAIRFEAVHFAYGSGSPVLRGIELEIAGGQTVALVGPNGAGKTTLLNLIPRFIDPTSGRISIDGQDLRQATLGSLRRQIGVVGQEPFLFSGTIGENIRYGHPIATDEEVWEAARVANAADFIRSLPAGMRTEVGERGQLLSGGQIQRIALARAIIRNPPILLLDEATSSIDPESETLIREALARLMRGRTTLVVAHRLSTVRRADRILVMEAGKIVEEGRHDSLIVRAGLYARICEEQFLAEGRTQ